VPPHYGLGEYPPKAQYPINCGQLGESSLFGEFIPAQDGTGAGILRFASFGFPTRQSLGENPLPLDFF